jgi:hypothetical protein
MATLRDLRDRALIGTLTYSFARITAALKMKVEDLRPRGAGWTIRPRLIKAQVLVIWNCPKDSRDVRCSRPYARPAA